MTTTNHPLRRFRQERGITQEQLAEMLGVNGVTVSRWETGQRRIDDRLLSMVAEKTGIAPIKLRPDLARFFEAAE